MTSSLLPMMGAKGQRLSLLLILFVVTALSTRAQNNTDTPALLIVPSFEHPPVSRYLPDSKRTLVTPVHLSKSGEFTYLKADEITTPEAWDQFVKEATENLQLQLATLDPKMIRDEHGVIQMAMVTTENPSTAACILLPRFLEHFSAVFGPELLITIPTRNKICIFPKLINHLPELASAIRDEYLVSGDQASTEIFELDRNGLRAVGSLDPDDE